MDKNMMKSANMMMKTNDMMMSLIKKRRKQKSQKITNKFTRALAGVK